MRRLVVLLTLVLSFVAPVAIPAAQAGEPDSVQARSPDTSCKRRRRAKKQNGDSKSKKKKDKKPYGFEL
jgi:Ni/Co efflux regulator RcnB